MRWRISQKWQVVWVWTCLTTCVLVVLYFCAYSVLHVRFPQARGPAAVEYWFVGKELPNQHRWRLVFRVANGIDRIVRRSTWTSGGSD